MAAATTTRRGNLLAATPEGFPTIGLGVAGDTYLGMTLGTIDTDGTVIAYADGTQGTVVGLLKTEQIIPAGDDDVPVELWRGVVAKFVGSAFVADDVGKEVYALDNQTVVLVGDVVGTESLLGQIVQFHSATQVSVRIYDDAGLTQITP